VAILIATSSGSEPLYAEGQSIGVRPSLADTPVPPTSMEDSGRWTHDRVVRMNRASLVARLLSGTAHEVNNALQTIAGTVELLLAGEDLDPSMRAKLERVLVQSGKAAAAVHRVLAFARAPSTTHAVVDLAALVRETIQLRDFSIRRAGHAIVFEDAASPACFVSGSRVLLQQALLNLVINAEQALRETRGTIDLALRRVGPWAELRVADTGPGVAPEIADRLFVPFAGTEPSPDAVGLGLAAAGAIAEAHGGTLRLERARPGAVFVLSLPVHEPPPSQAAP
jgi:signal transduction histidine kinase